MFGSTPAVHVAPLSCVVAYAIPDAPPPKKRPAWEVATKVFPNANVSGSTAVACWLVEFEKESVMIRVSPAGSARAMAAGEIAAVTTATADPLRNTFAHRHRGRKSARSVLGST